MTSTAVRRCGSSRAVLGRLAASRVATGTIGKYGSGGSSVILAKVSGVHWTGRNARGQTPDCNVEQRWTEQWTANACSVLTVVVFISFEKLDDL